MVSMTQRTRAKAQEVARAHDRKFKKVTIPIQPIPVPTAFVLLSGGMDSTTCLYMAREQFLDVRAISINYGQRHIKELKHAAATCKSLQIPHKILPIAHVVPKTMLTDKKAEVPDISYDQIKGVSPTYVPFRNGLMLSVLTSYIHGTIINEGRDLEGLEHALYFGAHAEDAKNWAYPDCTPEFIGSMSTAIYIGSYRRIRLNAPLMWMAKYQIVEAGEKVGVDWSKTWSCYKGDKFHCGICPTCRSRRAAFTQAGIYDPTAYGA